MRIRKRGFGICFILLAFSWQASVKAQTTVRQLVTTTDIAYAWNLVDENGQHWHDGSDDSLRFDIYYPPGANTSGKKYPMILSLHAGSFTGGSKEGQVSGADALNELGFVVVSPDYRTGYDNNTSPCADDTIGLTFATYRATQDGNACMRYLYQFADNFHIDTSNFFLMGNSAGADLALHMQYVNDAMAKANVKYVYDSLGGVQSTGNPYPYLYTVKGLCAMWGALPDWAGIINKFTVVPMILFKGGQDPGLPSDYTPDFGRGRYKDCPTFQELIAGSYIYGTMQSLKVPCVYHFQRNGFHAAYDEEFCTRAINAFFKDLINGTPPVTNEYYYYQKSW